jgi:hypothetical protein
MKEERTHNVYITRRTIETVVRAKLVTGAEIQALSSYLENIYSDWRCESTPNRANVFEIGMTLPGRSKLCLPAARP